MMYRPVSKISRANVGMLLAFFMVLQSCSDLFGPENKKPQPSSYEDLNNLWIVQHDYNHLSIGFPLDMSLDNDDVNNIVFSERVGDDATESQIVDSIEAVYFETDGSYSLVFTFVRTVPAELLYYDFTISYHLDDGTVVDVDTLFPMYKYPYAETEIIFDTGAKFNDLPFHVLKDVDRTDTHMYFRGFGPHGIGEYIIANDEFRSLQYCSGDYVVVTDTAYVFFDLGHGGLGRYNLDADSTDIYVYLPDIFPDFAYPWVNGLSISDGLLYVVIDENGDSGTTPMHLYRFDFSLQVVDSVQIDTRVYAANIRDNVLYYIGWLRPGFQLGRYNLATKEVMEPFLPPGDLTGIKFYGDKLYFTDYAREFIGAIPISALK